MIQKSGLSGAEETGDDGGGDTVVEIQSGGDGRVQVLSDGIRCLSGEASGMEISLLGNEGVEDSGEIMIETTWAGRVEGGWGCRSAEQESDSSCH